MEHTAYLQAVVGQLPRDFLGLALIPQAGVAIGLAAMGARIIGGERGGILQTIILSSSILYELIGPACAKLGLFLSRSYGQDAENDAPTTAEPTTPTRVNNTQQLKEQILAIQNRLAQRDGDPAPAQTAPSSPAEDIYGGDVLSVNDDEYYSIMDYMRRNGRFINRR